ncbi:FecR family protein [Niastella caeni]|nr:FecR family protein [Niastella caeni]
MKDNSRINDIIIKAITEEELTSTEGVALEQWLMDSENRKLYEGLKNKDYLLQKLMEVHKIDVEGDKDFIEQKLFIGKRIGIKKQWKIFREVATTAAAVVILTAAFFFWLNTRREKDKPAPEEKSGTIAQNDVIPGKTSALLTLADGSKVKLDSSVVGLLTQQGEMDVVNNNGTLIYQEKSQAKNELLFNTLSTANGETYKVVLADGSKVWLNAGASIRYPVAFTSSERKVEITGEAYFEVSPLPALPGGEGEKKPFIVHVTHQRSAGMDVQVVGTHFNINAYNDDDTIKTTLLEGSVKVRQDNSVTLLKPGQQAQVNNGITRVVNDANLESVVAWKNGRFIFNNADITVIMRQLARWYDIGVVYEGAKPTQLFVGEMERNLSLAQVMRLLEYSGIRFRIEGKKLIVMSQY